jgi:hypothetical protein
MIRANYAIVAHKATQDFPDFCTWQEKKVSNVLEI